MNSLSFQHIKLLKLIAISSFVLLFSGCAKQTENFETLSATELYPQMVGKYFIYRLDSTVFENGKNEVVKSYQVKHIIEQKTKDNLNRDAWRINTYLNDVNGSGPWVSNGNYIVVPIDKRVEVIENNLRVIKIQLPVVQGFTWKGNSFLPDRPYSDLYATSVDDNMNQWDFTYETVAGSETIEGTNYPNVTTVLQADESVNVPMLTNTVYAAREYSIEKYAKNLGLVYREHILWENQPRQKTTGTPPNEVITYDPVRLGFGVKMWLIEHN